MHHSNSYDLGARLTGNFGKKRKFGYSLMVGNGRGALAENNKSKKFYGEVYGKFLNKHIVVDLYADYERLNWNNGFHHSRNILKAELAYTSKKLTVGALVFTNNLKNDVYEQSKINNAVTDTLSGKALGFSAFIRGSIVKNKLHFFARYDHFNPDTKFSPSEGYNYMGFSKGYQHPNTMEDFITAGLDFSPIKHVHFMPNVWYQSFSNQNGKALKDYDLVYRLTFYFRYN